MNQVTERVYEYCRTNGLIKPGMHVLAGVSGGADSVCLLLVLKELSSLMGLDINAVHIEHGIRGEESRLDMEFVRSLCERLNVPLKIYEIDVPKKAAEDRMTLEEAGRYARYEAFDKEAESCGADVIAVAHHMGDQAETVLFNMARGSGLKGLGGMEPVRGRIIRPLLCISREQIEGYLEEAGQDYRTDSTNEDTLYSRNGIRSLVIPELERIVNGASRHITALSDEIREADKYIRDKALEVRSSTVSVKRDPGSKDDIYDIDLKALTCEPPLIQRYVIRSLFDELYGSKKDLEAQHVRDVLKLADGQSGRSVTLPKGIIARRDGSHILMGHDEDLTGEGDGICVRIDTDGSTVIPGAGTFTASVVGYEPGQVIPDGLYTKWFDYDKIVDGIFARNRREGDYLTIDDRGFRKKLKSYLIDEKVSALKRDKLIVLADGSHVIWVVGMRISSHYKIDDDTKRVIRIEYKGEHDGN
ncbi:MAG: tRNA lysidine(34) synthetase TilS [Lachnospiraceae bacterium]|nr:tRNA lysidine(34) synthetase TilS [Lachnospiraceae bacterium]